MAPTCTCRPVRIHIPTAMAVPSAYLVCTHHDHHRAQASHEGGSPGSPRCVARGRAGRSVKDGAELHRLDPPGAKSCGLGLLRDWGGNGPRAADRLATIAVSHTFLATVAYQNPVPIIAPAPRKSQPTETFDQQTAVRFPP